MKTLNAAEKRHITCFNQALATMIYVLFLFHFAALWSVYAYAYAPKAELIGAFNYIVAGIGILNAGDLMMQIYKVINAPRPDWRTCKLIARPGGVDFSVTPLRFTTAMTITLMMVHHAPIMSKTVAAMSVFLASFGFFMVYMIHRVNESAGALSSEEKHQHSCS